MSVEPLKILFVDDEQALALLGEEFLGDMGYSVTSCFSGEQALELIMPQPDNFDLLITDESMPGITGIELAQRVYELRKDLPVILCSGHLLTMHEAGMETTNIKDVLVKTEVCTKLPQMIEKLFNIS